LRAAWVLTALLVVVPRGARATPADTTAVPRMSVAQAVEQAKLGKILLVDVRPLPQRALGHVRGDVHLPFDAATPPGALPPGPIPVFYCSCPAEELALDVARRTQRAGRRDVAVLVGGYDAWRAAGQPIAVDASWEETFRIDEPPSGWGKTPIDSLHCHYGRDTTRAYRGVASGRVQWDADSTARGLAGLVQRVDAAELAGRIVTMTAMVRTRDVAHAAFLWVGAEDANGRMIAMSRGDREPLRGTGDWRAAAVTGGIPSNAAKLLYGVSLAGAGTVWLDEVRVTSDAAGGLPYVRRVVENAGFEE
jgi:rhodanese-related sulfurtransferase